MTEDDLGELAKLNATASAAPWHVVFTNDATCMSAVFVTKNPSTGRVYEAYGDPVDPADVVAACLINEPEVASVDDRCWSENARLIATMRNHLPELLRLAKVGLVGDRT